MHSIAAVEIEALPDGTLPVYFLHIAYRASRRGRITLILKDVRPEHVDEILDPLVHRMRRDIPGLLYVDGGNESAAGDALRNADVAFSTRELQSAHSMLDRLARPTRVEEM